MQVLYFVWFAAVCTLSMYLAHGVCVCVNQYCTAQGLLVKDVEELVEMGCPFPKGLFTIIPRKAGDLITGYWGTYRERLPKESAIARLDIMKLRDVPGN
jgi:hypothetical protein